MHEQKGPETLVFRVRRLILGEQRRVVIWAGWKPSERFEESQNYRCPLAETVCEVFFFFFGWGLFVFQVGRFYILKIFLFIAV